jgi:hypothetical protein
MSTEQRDDELTYGGHDHLMAHQALRLSDAAERVAQALVSPNVTDSNLEPANLVDTTQRIAQAGFEIARAIDRLAQAVDGASTELSLHR